MGYSGPVTESPEPVVQCRNVRKTYRDRWGRRAHEALRGVELTVRPGESVALLGPNGSGKSTCLGLIVGLLSPTAGEVRLFGRDPRAAAARRGMGYLPERSDLQPFLSCNETVSLHARLRGVPRRDVKRRVAATLDGVGLADVAKRRVHALSHGMRRRLALACALVGRPALLVLDEPTSGMDPLVRERVVDGLRAHRAAGGTTIVTSHLLGDVSGLAERAVLLAEGRVVREGEIDDLRVRPGCSRLDLRGSQEALAAAGAAATERGAEVLESGPLRMSIEELFVETYRDRSADPPAAAGDGAA